MFSSHYSHFGQDIIKVDISLSQSFHCAPHFFPRVSNILSSPLHALITFTVCPQGSYTSFKAAEWSSDPDSAQDSETL